MNNHISPSQSPYPVAADLAAYDGRSIMLNILSFIVPPLGLVLYLALMIAKLPRKATSVGRSATAGVIAYITVAVLAGSIALIAEELSRPRNDVEETVGVTRPPGVLAPLSEPK